MNILFLTEHGHLAPLARLAAAQGEKVRIWSANLGVIVPGADSVSTWRPHLDEADAIVVDETGHRFSAVDLFYGKKLIIGRWREKGRVASAAWGCRIPTMPMPLLEPRIVFVVGNSTLYPISGDRKVMSTLGEPIGNKVRTLPYIGPIALAYTKRGIRRRPFLTNVCADSGYQQMADRLSEMNKPVSQFLMDVYSNA